MPGHLQQIVARTQVISSTTVTEEGLYLGKPIGTSATTIVSYTPMAEGLFLVSAMFSVVNETPITIGLTWTSLYGTQTYNWVSLTSEPPGDYILSQVTIICAANGPVTVSATAGATNSVYASATIISVT